MLTLNLMQGNNKEESLELSDILNYHINHHYSFVVGKGEIFKFKFAPTVFYIL